MITDPPVPQYRIPYHHMLQAALYILKGAPRNLGEDFSYLLPHLPAAPKVEGCQWLPASGPIVIVGNHYQRPGLWMGWAAMIAGRAVYEHTRRNVRWVAISEWNNYRLVGLQIPPEVTRSIFTRFQQTFGFITMAPAEASPSARATAVRTALEAVRAGDVIGIFPEGDVGPTPALIPARPGSGLFLTALSRQKACIVPMGISEPEGRLHVAFGEAVDLSHIRSLPRTHQDDEARTAVMSAVARLLPTSLRGAYPVDSVPAGT